MRKLNLKTNFINNNQSGQALVCGLLFLLISMFCGIYFLFFSEIFIRKYSNLEKEREYVLRQAANIANEINQLSINNQTIIASLGAAENAFSEAVEISLYIGFTQPYWETYKNLNNNISEITNQKFNEDVLSYSSKLDVKRIYNSLKNQSARGLFLAKSLSEKNKAIVEALPKEISKYFVRASNSDVFCFALETQKKYYQYPGFHHLPILEKLYHFYLEKKSCKIFQTQGLFGTLIPQMPLISSSESDDILSFSLFDNLLKNVEYGIWFVPISNAELFLSALFFELEKEIEVNSKFTVVYNYLSKIKYFSFLDLNKNEQLSTSYKKIRSRITHPNFICSYKRNKFGDFLNEFDFQKIRSCSLNSGQFIKSFFYPKWTPIISSEKDN